MAADTVIELNVDEAAGPAAEPGLPPGWRRAFTVALLALACVASLVAAQPLAPPRLMVVATLDTPLMLSERVAGDALFAIVSGTRPTLQSYRLSDGSLTWSIPLPVPDSAASVEVAGAAAAAATRARPGPAHPGVAATTVLVHSLDPTMDADRTAAVDAATGRVLWHSPSFRVAQINAGSSALVFDRTSTAAGQGRRYREVDVRTGRQLWSYEVPAGWTTVLPDDPPGADTERHLISVSPTGAARSVELATGRQVAAADIDVGAPAVAEAGHRMDGPGMSADEPSVSGGPSLMVRGDELLVGYQDGAGSALTGYRADRLTPLWTIGVRSLSLRVDGCGALFCVGEAGQVRALRPDNGAVVWSGSAWPGAVGVLGRWLYTVSDLAAAYGVLPGGARLIDPGTGRTELDLGGWRLVSEPDSAGRPALFEYVERGTGRVWLGALGAGPHIDPLGTVDDLPYGSCDAGALYIVCLTTGDQVRIWRYRG